MNTASLPSGGQASSGLDPAAADDQFAVTPFDDCYSLTSIIIPNSVTAIGDYAFVSCGSLTNIALGTNILSIGNYSFWQCANVTNIAIPDSVNTIGNEAFSDCISLTSITIGNGVANIGIGVFNNCPNLTEIDVNALNSVYGSSNGILFSNNLTSLIFCPKGKTGYYLLCPM